MSTNPRKRQKQLERRAAKRKEKKHLQSRAQYAGLPEQLAAASKYPVLHCWMPDFSRTQGLGWVALSRALPNGTVAVASFLVDFYCLGVKDAHSEILPRINYDQKYVQRFSKEMPTRPASPAEARNFVEQAIAYAHDLGFGPHADYDRAKILFGDIDPSQSDATFEFGKDGKPFYISGPYDSPERVRQIMAILGHSRGAPGQGFHYMVGGPTGPPALLAGERWPSALPFDDEDEDEDES
jgi:hypothetical protein